VRRYGWFLAAGLLVCLVLAGVVSAFASSSPDGLEHAALQGCTLDEDGEIVGGTCMAQAERDHDLADSVFADYGVRGLDNEALGTGLAGLVGVLLTFAVGGGLFWLIRRRGAPTAVAGRGDGDAGPPA
jgi:cobalt/nickel transport protein